jgi:hypothetical protein
MFRATIKELDKAKANLLPNKAAGPDSIPYALWTSLEALKLLQNYNACKERGRIMDLANIIVLAKARDVYSCSQYRPISLTNTDYKILMKIWADRLRFNHIYSWGKPTRVHNRER